MKKRITVKELSKELVARINKHKHIDCCADEIKRLARLAAAKMPNTKVLVTWKEA
jgi:hypothetical protein